MVLWYKDEDYLSLSHFNTMWRECYPHVKIRAFKLVTGKCDMCATFCELRKTPLQPAQRELLNNLTAYHKFTYMSERQSYYDRRQLAFTNPQRYSSYILDGMAQTHSQVSVSSPPNVFCRLRSFLPSFFPSAALVRVISPLYPLHRFPTVATSISWPILSKSSFKLF